MQDIKSHGSALAQINEWLAILDILVSKSKTIKALILKLGFLSEA